MDQGIAAALAGIAGLIGAGIGGITAARGARIGAETAARATSLQVRDQATVDHEHWLRGQRLEAYKELLEAYDEYAIAASNVGRIFDFEITDSGSEHGRAFGQSVTAFRRAYFRVRLVGPEEIAERAFQLRSRIEDHNSCISELGDALLGRTDCSVAALRETEEELRLGLADLHSGFREEAARVLVQPSAVTHEDLRHAN
ncbi:hypothetical protein [Streptomyces sp. NPDC006925]|uniref:hypothetical protein n=1 Tax=Streptomyces sp. NPDC006925 TaxID=3364768 RepID=UPI003691034F